MGRNGVTKEQVLAVAERLHAEGEKITVKRVREELGETGSYTTISAALKLWRSDRGMTQVVNEPLPPVLERSTLRLVGSLWRTVTSLVRKLVMEDQSATGRRLDEVEAQLHRSQQELTALGQRWDDQRGEVGELEHEMHQTERHIEELRAALEATRQQIEELAQIEAELLRHIDKHGAR
jgi:DNA repair exonuclease SbcCD ATPase subunit